jgi:hypothetical protein
LSVNFDAVRSGQEKDILLQPFDIVEVGKAPKKFTDYLKDFGIGITNRLPIPL